MEPGGQLRHVDELPSLNFPAGHATHAAAAPDVSRKRPFSHPHCPATACRCGSGTSGVGTHRSRFALLIDTVRHADVLEYV